MTNLVILLASVFVISYIANRITGNPNPAKGAANFTAIITFVFAVFVAVALAIPYIA